MEHLLEDYNTTKHPYERVTATPQAVPLGVSPSHLLVGRGAPLPYTPAPSRYTPAPLLSVPRLKVEKPKAWAGSFKRVEREAFLKSAGLYLAAHGVHPSTLIGEQETPEVFYNVRAFFSPELGVGGLSPQMWFDSVNRRRPFHSFSDIAREVRKHWADDAADETAFETFRKAKQGSAPARVFGATVDALATACFDREISDVDRQSTFLAGLNPNVLEFVKTQRAARRSLGLKTISFDKLVDIAAETDSLPSFKKPDKPAASSSSPSSSRKTSGTESRTAPSSEALAKSQKWVQSVIEWQKKHPEVDASTWLNKTASAPPTELRGFNCGRVGRHFSRACPSRRANPQTVIMALMRLMVLGVPSSSSSLPLLTIEEDLPPSSGNEADE